MKPSRTNSTSIFNEVDEFESGIYSAGYDGAMVVRASKTPQYVNKAIGQIAKEEGKAPIDVLCDILLANDGDVNGVYFNQCATDLLRIMRHPRVFCGSDWNDYPDERYDPEREGGGHPRATATTVRRLELVRDFRLRTMEESIKNLSYDTAKAMHLEGIGLLKEGWNADICICEYDKLHACADYRSDLAAVFVHGFTAGDLTGALTFQIYFSLLNPLNISQRNTN